MSRHRPSDQADQSLPITKDSPLDGTAELFAKDKRTLLNPANPDHKAMLAKVASIRSGMPSTTTAAPTPFEYALPQRLIDLLVQDLGERSFNNEMLQYERQLATRTRNGRQIGFWGDWPIVCDLLLDEPFSQDPTRLDPGEGKGRPSRLNEVVEVLNRRLSFIERPRLGYAGWLVTNRSFMSEHDSLLNQYRERFLTDGFPVPHETADLAEPPRFRRAHPPRTVSSEPNVEDWFFQDDQWLNDYRSFCERWRLSHLAGPHLPEPRAPQIPLGISNLPGTQLFSIPDVYPIGGRGFIGEAIEDALRGGSSMGREHLQEWFDIVGAKNPAKNRIDRSGRLLRLQHFWRVLHQRHADALHRRKGRLVTMFSKFFGLSEDVIKGDLRLIEKNLGQDWPKRPDPLSPA